MAPRFTGSAGRKALTPASPALVKNQDGRLDVFLHSNPGTVHHIWQDPAGLDGWSQWDTLGDPQVPLRGQPEVARNKDGRLEVFMLGSDGALWHIWQDPSAADGWSPRRWHSLEGPGGLSRVATGGHADGRLVVFAVAEPSASASPQEANAIWQREQLLAGGWSAWRPFTRPDRSPPVRDPALALDANKRLQLWLGIKGSGPMGRWADRPRAYPTALSTPTASAHRRTCFSSWPL